MVGRVLRANLRRSYLNPCLTIHRRISVGLQRLKLHNTTVPQLASVPPLYMNLVCPGKQGKRCPNFDRPSREKELVEEMLNTDP